MSDSPLQDLLEEHELRQAHDHLSGECGFYRMVNDGQKADHEQHCGSGSGGALVKFTARTPEASTVPQPTVPPGGPGLWHVKGMQLPPYIQHLYKHLVGRYGKQKAYGVAVGVVKKWAAGVNPGGWKTKSGKGKRTHPDVQAAAQRNVAEWEEKRARAHAQHRQTESRTRSQHALAASVVSGGSRRTEQDVDAPTSFEVELAGDSWSAPGISKATIPPAPGGSYEQYGLHQKPAQTIQPSPPLPPNVPRPTAKEILQLAADVPECSQAYLSTTARTFLRAAAVKLQKDDDLQALAMLRSAQSALRNAHRADLGATMPWRNVANVYSRVPPAEQSSATALMLQGRDRALEWRGLETRCDALLTRLRKRFFHGRFNGPSERAMLSATLADEDFPGRARKVQPPVPGSRDAKAMFTAHRIDDTLEHLAHAVERLRIAKQSKALRAYHMTHVNNHLSTALDDAHNLAESVRRNYPAEARELAALTKTIGLAASVSPETKAATFAHLLQTLLYHEAHTKRHTEAMADPNPDGVWQFNYMHAEKHLAGALEHCFKLARHVMDNYPDEAKWLKELDEVEDPSTDYTGLAAPAPAPVRLSARLR